MADPTVAMIARLRRMVSEPTDDTYTDDDLSEAIARYPLPDVDGYDPDDTLWAGAWDMNAAAAEVWDEKAAGFAADFDFAADGGDYKRSQVYMQMLSMARSFRAKRSTGTLTLIVDPKPTESLNLQAWIGNLAEPTDP